MYIGKIMGGFILVPTNPNSLIKADEQHAIIAEVEEPDKSKMFPDTQIGFYRRSDVAELKTMRLFAPETFKMLLDNKVLTHEFSPQRPICADWLLSELVQGYTFMDPRILDIVWNDSPETYDNPHTLNLLLALSRNVSAAQFIAEKIRSRRYAFDKTMFKTHCTVNDVCELVEGYFSK